MVDGKNKLSIVFDEALIGKKVQIEPFRGTPGLSTKPEYVRTTTVQETPNNPKIAQHETASLWLTSQCESVEKPGEMIDKDFKNYFKLNSLHWVNPLDIMELRGWYGEKQWTPTKSTFHGRTGGKHDGLDLYSPVGKNIYACFEGNITFREDLGGYGNRIFLEGEYRGKTYYLMYSHLTTYKTGPVKIGDIIGTTGQTGNAKGQASKMAHLHFEVRTVKNSKPSFDPLQEIKELGNTVVRNPDKNSQK